MTTISYEQALTIAEDYVSSLNSNETEKLLLHSKAPMKVEGGWKFSYNSESYVKGGDDPLMGYLKFAVSTEGVVCTVGDGTELGEILNGEASKPFF